LDDKFSLVTGGRATTTERARLETRLARLVAMESSATKAAKNLQSLARSNHGLIGVTIRNTFVRRTTPAPGDFSDRVAPPPQLRPPCTRLISPRGAALRLYLTALFEAQVSSARRGNHPKNLRLIRGEHDAAGWEDLIASPAEDHYGRVNMTAKAKVRRQIQQAIRRLHREGLVALPNIKSGWNKYENFDLLNEGGEREHGPNIPYIIPKSDKDSFIVPLSLFTEGWIHVLEDSEIAFILMIASLRFDSLETVAVPGDIRLREFGLGRDSYEAHVMLNRLKLLEVWADRSRFPDGTVSGYSGPGSTLAHRFKLLQNGFRKPAHKTALSILDHTLDPQKATEQLRARVRSSATAPPTWISAD
jgi:hypothetical protein